MLGARDTAPLSVSQLCFALRRNDGLASQHVSRDRILQTPHGSSHSPPRKRVLWSHSASVRRTEVRAGSLPAGLLFAEVTYRVSMESLDASAEPVPVLLVDDEQRNLTALDVVLQAPGRRLIHAPSGEEALKLLLEGESVAVMILDVNMPGINGLETAALIRGREQSRYTPIIFLTAGGSEGEQRGYELGAVDYLMKPFDPAALRAKVAVFEELFRKSREIQRLALEAADRARLEGALLAIQTAEHELGNQLAGASGQLQLVLRGQALDPATRVRIQTAVVRMSEAAETVRRLRNLTNLHHTDWGTAGSTINLGQPAPSDSEGVQE